MKNTPMIEYENLAKFNKVFFDEYKKAFAEFLEKGWYVLGEQVYSFENSFSAYNKSPYCVGVASGLDAITLSLKALDLPKGAEVIVPSNTYIATILSILHVGGVPVLVEPDIKTYNLDPKKIEEKITKKTKVILPVHLYGKLSEMEKIMEIAKDHKLAVVEDCAQAHGANYQGKNAGTFGNCGAFSFYPTKNLGALGDAGAIICHDETTRDKLKMLRNYGSIKKYYNEVVGYNSRLDELQAAMLKIKLGHLDKITEHKRKLAKIYLKNLKEEFIKPVVQKGYYDVFHIFAIRHPKRDALKQYLLDNEIKTEIHYPLPPHKQKAMKGILAGNYPISEEIHDTILSLPISYFHTKEDINRVVEVMNRFS